MSDFYKIRKTLKHTGNKPNIDYWYGPYESEEAALLAVGNNKVVGLTVGIYTDSGNKIKEKWFQKKQDNTWTLVDKTDESLYGPYTTKEEVYAKIPVENRYLGLTVGIKQFIENESGIYVRKEITQGSNTYYEYVEDLEDQSSTRYSFLEVEEFQFKKTINNLEKKGESSLSLQLISQSKMKIQENTPITIKITGGVTPTSIQVYEVINEQEFITSYHYPGTIPLNSEISLNLNISGNPRTITYRIRVIDKNNTFATTVDETNYVEVNIDYKEIELYELNLSSINSLIVKNANNLQDKTFTFKVGYIQSIENYTADLYIGDSLISEAIEQINQDQYKVTLPSSLSQYGGQDIKIKISYTEEGNIIGDPLWYNIVTIIAKGVFSNIQSEFKGNIFYIGSKVSCRIYFESEEQATYSIESTDDSDFSYSGRIMSYTWNTIYIDPREGHVGTNPKFKFLINGTKEVTINSEEGSQIKIFDKQIYPGQANPTTEEFKNSHQSLVKSFILDINCFINWTNNRTENNNPETILSFANITITKDYIQFGTIKYPTPLQRNVHLGFEYQVEYEYQVSTVNSQTTSTNKVVYNALYIDGVLSKNAIVEEANQGQQYINNFTKTDNFTILNNGINIYLDTTKNLNPFTSRTFNDSDRYIPIIQNNYEYYSQEESENYVLPLLKLKALPLNSPYYTTRNNILGDKAIVPSMFGSLQDGQQKYNESINLDNPNDLYNILLKQRTSLKKALQKSRGVLCEYEYEGDTGYVEVHTQGTSTLDYRLPNFKFTFLDNNMNPQKVGFVSGYSESVLTAKTDYMDSSHLNNTPTATYYNKVIQSGFFNKDGVDYRSPSAQEGGLDAITGVPIIMSIQDVDSEEYINYGSFMLNVDKTGDALKFNIEDEEDECISFEGTSNAAESGLSSRFDIKYEYQSDFSEINSIIESGQLSSLYSEINSKGKYIINKSDAVVGSTLYKMVRILNYLAEGLEYRYPDNDIISNKGDYYQIMPINHFKRLFKMFYWVANSSSLSKSEYRQQFVQYFNYDYCALYFIFLMIFAQTDNLGKNCMFDQWFDEDIPGKDSRWYPRPYDLDSQTGLDNNGNDNIAPFVEISPVFSLNYEQILAAWDGTGTVKAYLENNYLDPDSTLIYPEDVNGEAKRYSFSSSGSNLWFNFYKNFKEEIRETYRELRNYTVNSNLVYSQDGEESLLSFNTITSFYKEFVLNKLGKSQYNLDFQLKYLGDPTRQHFGLGNRWDKFNNWLQKRIQFCDIYFYYKYHDVELTIFNQNILFDSPQYIMYKYSQDNGVETVLFFNGEDPVNMNISGDSTGSSGQKYIFWINTDAILEGPIYSELQSSKPRMPFNSIKVLNTNGKTLNGIVDITKAQYLTDLTINNLNEAYSKVLPTSIKHITIQNSIEFINTIQNLPYLESLTIRNCQTKGKWLHLQNLGYNKPINLTIEDSELSLNLENVEIEEFNFSNNVVSNLVINNCTIPSLSLVNQTIGAIGFSGSNSSIDIIDFRRSTFTNPVLDLSIVANNLKHLLLSDSVGLQTVKTSNNFSSLQFIGLMNSDVENFTRTFTNNLGEEDWEEVFDGTLLPSTLPKSLYCQSYSEKATLTSNQYVSDIIYNKTNNNYYSGGIVATRDFNLEQTKIRKVKNLTVQNQTSSKLFTNCSLLTEVVNSTINCSGLKMFKNCTLLNNLNGTSITVSDNNASYMFASCNDLAYSIIEDNLITNFTSITNFEGFMFNRIYNSDTTIDLSIYSSATSFNRAFTTYLHTDRGYTTYTQPANITITFSGIIPSGMVDLTRAFDLRNNYVVFEDWDTLISNCTSLTTTTYAFYGLKPSSDASECYEIDSDWFPNTNTELSLDGTFATARVMPKDKNGNKFQFKSNVILCRDTFFDCPKIEGKDNYDVSNIFENCTKLKSIVMCFRNNGWATTTDSLVLSNHNPVIIAGVFSTTSTDGGSYPEVYGRLTGQYTQQAYSTADGDLRYRTPYGSNQPENRNETDESRHSGAFYRRKVKLPAETTLSYGSDDSSIYGLFEEAYITLTGIDENNPNNELKVTLSSENIGRVFRCTKIVPYQYNNQTYRGKLNVTLLNTKYAVRAFDLGSVSNRNNNNYYTFLDVSSICNPPKLPTTIEDASYMFQYSRVNNIPINYFQDNNNDFYTNIRNTSYMFAGTLITSLPSDSGIGLLPNCIENVSYMFYYCTSLRGGVPNNLFNINNNLTSLAYMFAYTGVLYKVQNNDLNSIMTPIDIKTQTPNVVNVSGLFMYQRPSGFESYLQRIRYNSFEKCTNLSYLFAYSPNPISTGSPSSAFVNDQDENTNNFKIDRPVNLEATFAGLAGHTINFIVENLNQLTNIKGILQQISSSTDIEDNSTVTDGIYTLIASLLSTRFNSRLADLVQGITMDGCFGRWAKNLTKLSNNLSITDEKDINLIQYWYDPIPGLQTSMGTIS